MTDCPHTDVSEKRYRTSKKVVKDGQPCTLGGWQYEVYCMNPRCLRTVRVDYEWDSEPECP